MLYVGVDLHRKASQVAVVDEQGKLLFNRHVPSHREDLLRIFGEANSHRGG
jgi:transposase